MPQQTTNPSDTTSGPTRVESAAAAHPALAGPPGLVIFDCDGVLVNTEPVTLSVMTAWLNDLGMTIELPEVTRSCKGVHISRIQRWAEDMLGRPLSDFVTGYRERMFDAFRGGIDPMPGVPELLDALETAGIPYCVGSNGPYTKMDASLTGSKLMTRLGGLAGGRIFSADDVPNPKPAPDLFIHAAAAMGIEPVRCVVVEDSPSGIAAALAAGMAAVGSVDLTPADELAASGAHAVVDTPAGLIGLLGLGGNAC